MKTRERIDFTLEPGIENRHVPVDGIFGDDKIFNADVFFRIMDRQRITALQKINRESERKLRRIIHREHAAPRSELNTQCGLCAFLREGNAADE